MLPTRAHDDPLRVSAGTRADRVPDDSRPALVVAASASEVEQFRSARYVPLVAHTTPEAVELVERRRPWAVVIDWDMPEFDGPAICNAARLLAGTVILVITGSPASVPSALKAGCHSVLLRPLMLSLVSTRLGRLAKEMATAAAKDRAGAKPRQAGTNRTCPEIPCPDCGGAGAVFFDYSSHRRWWYACLRCEAVWLGRPRE